MVPRQLIIEKRETKYDSAMELQLFKSEPFLFFKWYWILSSIAFSL